MKKPISICEKTILIFILFAFMVGCSILSPQTIESPIQELLESTLLSSKLPPPITPMITPTETIKPSPPSPATLPPEEATEAILGYYADNGGCELPCWWGIDPGVTTWEEAYEKMAPLGEIQGPFIRDEGVSQYSAILIVPKENSAAGFFHPGFSVKNNIVTAIGLYCNEISESFDCSLAGLLKRLGEPEGVWIKPIIDAPGDPGYVLSLFYPSKGIEIYSEGLFTIEENNYYLCPRDFRLGQGSPGVAIWNPNQSISFLNSSRQLFGENSETDFHAGFYRIEDLASNYDSASFYKAYIIPN